MYSNKDIVLINKQIKKFGILYCIMAMLLISLFIMSLIYRIKLATILISIAFGFFSCFYFGLFLLPHINYKKALNEIVNGKKRKVEGIVKSIEKDSVFARDGVDSMQILLKTGEDRHGDDELVLYFDIKKDFSGIQIGKLIEFTVFDRIIYSYLVLD